MTVQEPKPIRQRRCAICSMNAEKKALYRVVRQKDGSIAFDATGRVAGRGAYICSIACLEAPQAAKRIERSLKASVSAEDFNRVAREMGEAMNEEEEN